MTTESRQPAQAILPERLVAVSTGTIEWRVADPASGAYCIAYSRADYLDPEREAREVAAQAPQRVPDRPLCRARGEARAGAVRASAAGG